MKFLATLLLTLSFFLNAFAQIRFENGYFIDNDDKKVKCLIRNQDWGKAPDEFKYKLSENGPIETGNPSNE